MLIIDDTGFPEQGKHSVGVARQYNNALGKVGNCQIAVTLQHQVDRSVACIDADLYPRELWMSDDKHLKKACVPEGVGYRPKWQIALEMIQRALNSGLRGSILADAAYGTVTKFRQRLMNFSCLGVLEFRAPFA